MNLHEKVLQYIRTYVPIAVGGAVAWLLAVTKVDLSGEFAAALIAVLVAASQNLYYVVIRVIEVRFPLIGVLLGFPKSPEYIGVGNIWASFIRTLFPTVIGVALFLLANIGLQLDAETQSLLIVVLVAVAQAVYYTAATEAIRRYPGLKWMLGADAPVTYVAKHS